MNFSVNTLMSMTKKDLVSIIENLSRERDELFDELTRVREDLNEVETYEDEFHSLEIAKDLMGRIKDSKFKLDLGVETEREEIAKCLDKLEEILA